MNGISKRFDGAVALDSVDLAVEAGTIHAVVGENGAGKTTLMRILYGAERMDAGSIDIFGLRSGFRSSREAIAAGIGMVSQHTSVIPELTCLENLILGAESSLWLDERGSVARAEALASKVGLDLDWGLPASDLSPAATQKLEILKLLWRDASILILDEPTAMLSPADADGLFSSLESLVDAGSTAILVTHRLPEVMERCKRATVLRAGRRVAEFDVASAEAREIAVAIVGSAFSQADRKPSSTSDPMLEIRGLTFRNRSAFAGGGSIDLQLRRGEVLGIAGVDGNGQRELVHGIAGTEPLGSGTIAIDSENIESLSSAERIARGVHTIPEDRQAEGMIAEWSVEDNAILGYQRCEPISRGRWIDRDAKAAFAMAVKARLDARFDSAAMPMGALSGGNQQRMVAARALELSPRIIVAFQPARGMDIVGTASVYNAIRERCAQGASAIVVSFDLDELIQHCDRIVAMRSGQVFEAPPGKERDRETIGRLMVGAA